MNAEPLTESILRKRVWPRFARTRKEVRRIYLANHSLGRPPDRMAQDVQHALDVWYHDMGEAWTEWNAASERFRALTARLVGAKRPDCIIPKASAGQGLRAVLNALEISHRGYVIETGRIVLEGPSAELMQNQDVREFYLGAGEKGRKSYQDAKRYKRKKRWL